MNNPVDRVAAGATLTTVALIVPPSCRVPRRTDSRTGGRARSSSSSSVEAGLVLVVLVVAVAAGAGEGAGAEVVVVVVSPMGGSARAAWGCSAREQAMEASKSRD